jgi:hypothetical protein
MELVNRINQLPKELQDLIGEFNVNHRIQMRNILNQLLYKDIYMSNNCSACNKIINKNNMCEGLYVYMWKRYLYCGEECAEMDYWIPRERTRWLRRLNATPKPIANKMI